MAVSKIHSARKDNGFTLIELLVVISIIALLMAILIPALQKARKMAQRVICAANLHQWSLSLENYATDNRGQLPRPSSCVYVWSLNRSRRLQMAAPPNGYGATASEVIEYFGYAINPYIKNSEMARCPANKTWKRHEGLILWGQSYDSSGDIVYDRDGQYSSHYAFFIDGPIPALGKNQYYLASAHGYIQKKVPEFRGARRGNLLVAQDLTYARSDVYALVYPEASLSNHYRKAIPALTDFDNAVSQRGYVDDNIEGANSLFLQGNV